MALPVPPFALLHLVLFTITLFIVSDGRRLLSFDAQSDIAVPPRNRLHLALRAHGFQHYIYNGSSWNLKSATANLYTDENSNLVGQHFFLAEKDAEGGQPSWRTFSPQSLVTAKPIKSVTQDAGSITWTLLKPTNQSGNE